MSLVGAGSELYGGLTVAGRDATDFECTASANYSRIL